MGDSVDVPRLLSVKQVARITGVQRFRIYAWIRSGDGPPFLKIGKTFRFPEDQLVAWIREQSAKGGAR